MVISRDFEAPNLAVVTLSGVVTARDQASLVEWVRGSIRLAGSVRVLVSLEQFAGWNVNDYVDGDAWWLQDDEGVSMIAIVGEPEWKLAVLTLIAQPLRRIPIRYFETEGAARQWLQPSVGSVPRSMSHHRPAG